MIPQVTKMLPEFDLKEWKAFTFETGSFLLHVPSAHILEVSARYVDYCRGNLDAPEIGLRLAEIAADLPRTKKTVPAIDIRTITLNVAQSCNLRCTYCYAGDGDYGRQSSMSFEIAKRAIDFFAAGKPFLEIAIFGGEPLLNFPLVQQIVAYCESYAGNCRFSFRMTTNGTLLTGAIATFLKEKNFKLTISYDGKKMQNEQRLFPGGKQGSGDLVEAKLKRLEDSLRQLRSLTLRTTVDRSRLDDFAASYLSNLTSFQYTTAFSRVASHEEARKFTAADATKVSEVLEKIVDDYLAAGDYEKIMRMANLSSHIWNFERGVTNRNACSAGVNYLSVSTQGKFFLCHRFTEDNEECVGSLDEGLDAGKLQQYADHRGLKSDPCSSCWMRQWCAGGCFHENKMAHGSTTTIDHVFCMLRDGEMKQAMRAYTHIKKFAPGLLAKNGR
jgi:uncharacterized protein